VAQPNGDWSLDSKMVRISEAFTALASVRLLTGRGAVITADLGPGFGVAAGVCRFLNM